MTSSTRRGGARWKDVAAIVVAIVIIILLGTALYFMWTLFGVPNKSQQEVTTRDRGPNASYRDGPPAEFNTEQERKYLALRVKQWNLSIEAKEALLRKQLEFITPEKITGNNLDEQDFIFGVDQLWKASTTPDHPAHPGPDTSKPANLSSYNSGHFKHKEVPHWDPHPQYIFSAFGRHFQLSLELNSEFVSSNLKAHHVSPNATYAHAKTLPENVRNCFYTGKVVGDSESRVTLNLCHGMRGIIRTSKVQYNVEPVEEWPAKNSTDVGSSPSVHHAIYLSNSAQCNKNHSHLGTHQEGDPMESQCSLLQPEVDENVMPQQYQETTKERDAADGGDDDHINNTLNPQEPFRGHHRSKRSMGSYSKQLHIAVKVVTDRKMLEYHGDDLLNYVMNLMATVSKVFRDASIGNHIIVKLVDFESRPDKLFYSLDSPWYTKYGGNGNSSDVWATEILKNFCAWQYQTRLTPDKNRNYDTAVLLTRENLCRYNNLSSCGTLGLAEVGSVCNPQKSCSIVQDNGLSAASTIAHELGHVLNMKHDNDYACKRLMEPTGIHYMMAHMPGINTNPWAWSNCSRHYLTEFLEAGHGHCLEDKPDTGDEDYLVKKEQTLFPGEHYEASRQCSMLYGYGSKICPYMPKCATLWCSREHVGKDGCISQFIPWADGTPCGHNQWCQKGSCVTINRDSLKPRHGSWSSWGPWGECSRSCGGGIRQARRECNNPAPEHGGHYCLGERVKYESCQTQDCPYGSRDFREMQCAKYNSAGEKKWIPKYFGSGPEEQCKLYCRGQYSDYHILFADKVIDGTPCSPTTYNVCVNGKCRAAGCDHRLGSSKTLDSCGVCDGDDSTCHVVTGSYNVSAPEYQRVVVIPAGSTNIYIRQTSLYSHSPNTGVGDNIHLALRLNDTGTYILNGGYNVRPYHSRILEAGAPISYTGAKAQVEILNSTLEPIKVALVLEVFIVGKPIPPNIEYSYTMHYPYIWKAVTEWSVCRNCTRTRTLDCFEQKTGQTVSKSNCLNTGQRKPDWQKPCIQPGCNGISKINKCFNDQDKDKKYCKRHGWVFGNWTKCEPSCGNPVFQTRHAKCVNLKHKPVPHSHCEPLKPEDTRRLCTKSCPARWQVSDWTPCSVECGHGVRKRPLSCELHGRKVAEFHCPKNQARTPTHQECFETKGCVGHWTTSALSQCSVTCGVGVAQRQVICILPTLNNMHAPDDRPCAHMTRPHEVVECSMPACKYQGPQTETPSSLGITAKGSSTTAVTGRPSIITDNMIVPHAPPRPPMGPHLQVSWIEEPWSECSVSCGIGLQRRFVQCWAIEQQQVYPDSVCEQLAARPGVQRACSQTCGVWRPRDWQPCSATCGKGVMYREVECEAEWTRVKLPETACSSHERPNVQASCEGPPCHISSDGDKRWSTGSWGECTVSGKSGCGMGQKRRQVKCLHGVCEGVVPPDTEQCMVPCHDAIWNYGEWGRCTRPCGGGWRYRLVRCQSVQGAFLEEEACVPSEKPTTTEECNKHRCLGYRWKTGPWGQCSERCGRGFKYRAVECVTSAVHAGGNQAAGQPVEAHYCGGLPRKPAQSRGCYRYQCSFAWQIGEWSECSASCGSGHQSRNVSCHRVNPLGWLELNEIHEQNCQGLDRPTSQQACNLEPCSAPYHWSTGPWTQCTAQCGKRGRQRRAVLCFKRDGTKVHGSFCRAETMPTRRRRCNQRKCHGAATCKEMKFLLRGSGPLADGPYTLTILGRNVTLYCHDMSGPHPREYLSLPSGEGENFSEFYHLSLNDPSTCPNNGHRWDSCPCAPETKGLSGTTVFSKIRLNVNTMRVKTDDYTFARTIRGKRRMPYGEAGDCYSHAECPQGRFSVNLTGTPFRVSTATGWLSNGSMIQRTDEEHQKVWGKCGGLCGTCSPRKETGLKLDLVAARHTRHHWRS